MNILELSKTLSWLLRHGALEAGVTMDQAGWVPVPEVLRYMRISRDVLDEVVETNTKSRLEVRDERIRACQGHSTENMPVTLEALEASWRPYTDGGSLFHGTTVEAIPSIAKEGLVPQKRTHVHLAPSLDSKVGKRSQTPVVLEISVLRLRDVNIGIFEAQNGVILARYVPPRAVVGLSCTTRKASAMRAALASSFGL